MSSFRRDTHIAVYGDNNLNIVDGSAVWLQSVALAAARTGVDRVTVVLKAPVERSTLVQPLVDDPRIRLVEPAAVRSLNDAAHAVAALRPDVVVVRSSRAASLFAGMDALRGRLWSYLTDIPQHPLRLSPNEIAHLERIVEASQVLLCQTEGFRSHLETLVPSAVGRTWLLPPMLPAAGVPQRSHRQLGGRPIRLAYAGKFAPRWRTLEMTELPMRLGKAGLRAELELIGDKIHDSQDGFRARMRSAMTETERVRWVGALPRQQTLERLSRADIGLAWRDPSLDRSLELSTKLLEYGAIGLPAVLNRTDDHVALLGDDYPLFVRDDPDDVVASIASCIADPARHELAVDRLRAAASSHTFDAAVERLRRALVRFRPTATVVDPGRPRPTRLLVASHDLKFLTPITDVMDQMPTVDLRFDHWPHLLQHDEGASLAALADADVVLCEWAGPNAVWYSKHRRRGQRLVIRLHRFELYRRYPRQIDIDAVDTVICVNEHYRDKAIRELGWPPHKVVVVPNFVDGEALDRQKAPDARFRIGMIGAAPMRKRLDLGIEVVSRLRRIDPRFSLVLKTKLAREYGWVWSKAEERAHYERLDQRIDTDPSLRDAVHVDRFAPDVAHWLRRVGWVLSTSEDESFHLATAEGMASGAVPVVRDWEGADGVYDREWIHDSVDSMVDRIATTTLEGGWDDMRRRARRQARRWDLMAVTRQFEGILLR